MMLQQEHPEDFVIATGQQISVRAFIEKSASILGIKLRWEGSAAAEIGVVANVNGFAGEALKAGDVIVIRYEGPKGGPGMQEMLAPTSALIGQGLGESVGLITDGRFPAGLGAWWSDTSRPKLSKAVRLRSSRKATP